MKTTSIRKKPQIIIELRKTFPLRSVSSFNKESKDYLANLLNNLNTARKNK